MNLHDRRPRGRAWEGRAAGRGEESAGGGFPQEGYHDGGRRTRGPRRLLTAVAPQGARCAGVIERRDEVLVLTKRVDFERHCLRLPEPSWAFDREVLRRAQVTGVTRVEVRDEVGRVWWSALAYLRECGEAFDRGHGKQIRLPLRLWSFLPADSAARQLGLFAEAAR